ncbi:MAG: hypothetical protein J5950_04545 [Clostridia bacterium]|nr:hypothetical protein [Clostridia bacterium]
MKNKIKLNGTAAVIVVSLIFALAFTAAGAITAKHLTIPDDSPILAAIAFTILGFIAVMLAMLVAGFIIKRKNAKKKNNVAQMREEIMQNKDRIQEDFIRAKKKLRAKATWLIIYEIFKFVFLCFLAFIFGFRLKNLFNIVSFILFAWFFARFLLSPKDNDFSNCQKEEDYPRLYELARKAARTLGITKNIVIYINSNCSVSIALAGDTVILYVGAVAMDILNSEELYNIFLHEFAHVRNDSDTSKLEDRISLRLTALYDHHFFKRLTVFSWVTDLPFLKEHMYYKLFGTIVAEENADNVILEFGDPQVAGNALTKTIFNDDFLRESPGYFSPDEFYGEADPVNNYLSLFVERFRQKLPERAEFWRELHKNELLPNISTHPILRDRLAKLGLTLDDVELKLPLYGENGDEQEAEYRTECAKALKYCDGRLFEIHKNSYLEDRRTEYLDPLRRINEWERGGKELTPDTIKQVCSDLAALGRFDEEEAVCDRAIAEFNDEQKDHACLIKGMCLLNKYDENGIDYIYKATNNSNYIDTAIDRIGTFVNMMGLSERRDAYREWVVDISQQKLDKFDKMNGLSVADKLESEPLEGTMLDDLLDYFLSIDEGKISKIYLVRKVITEDFFTSYFIIDFEDDTPPSLEREVMDKIFERLDTGYEWQFCLDRYSLKFAAALAKVPGSCVYDKAKGRH